MVISKLLFIILVLCHTQYYAIEFTNEKEPLYLKIKT